MSHDLNKDEHMRREVIMHSPVIAIVGRSDDHYYTSYQVGEYLIQEGFTVYNVNPNAPLNIPASPEMPLIVASRIPNVYSVYCTSHYPLTDEYVKSDILATVAKVVKEAGFPPVGGSPEFVGFNSHQPFELTVSTDAIKGGFYDRLNGLQGKRRTWYTGATWQTHGSSPIWNFTEYNILPSLLDELDVVAD